jgi:hypothetical protein
MFKRIFLRASLLLAVLAALAAYYAPWLQAEWNIASGRQAFERGEFQAAINKLTPVVAKPQGVSLACWDRPDCPTYLRRVLAQSHLALGQDDAALGHYRKLKDSRAHFLQGLDAFKARNWNASVEHFNQAIQLERDCEVCGVALKNAESAQAAHVNGNEAKRKQAKALADMLTPTKCLCSIAGITAITVGASAVLPPQLVNLLRKAGTTKHVAEEAINRLAQALSPSLRTRLNDFTGDVCPPLSENETIKLVLENETVKWMLDWTELVPFRGDAHRATMAAIQTSALAG